jgi:hypothetical protein
MTSGPSDGLESHLQLTAQRPIRSNNGKFFLVCSRASANPGSGKGTRDSGVRKPERVFPEQNGVVALGPGGRCSEGGPPQGRDREDKQRRSAPARARGIRPRHGRYKRAGPRGRSRRRRPRAPAVPKGCSIFAAPSVPRHLLAQRHRGRRPGPRGVLYNPPRAGRPNRPVRLRRSMIARNHLLPSLDGGSFP